MKVVILAGGFGTRISEESQFKPKPMVELGGMPIIRHKIKQYSTINGLSSPVLYQHILSLLIGNSRIF